MPMVTTFSFKADLISCKYIKYSSYLYYYLFIDVGAMHSNLINKQNIKKKVEWQILLKT